MTQKYYFLVSESISERGSSPSCAQRNKSFLFLSTSFFLIGLPGARKHHINPSLMHFIYKSVTFLESVETEFFFAVLATEKSKLTAKQSKAFISSAPPA